MTNYQNPSTKQKFIANFLCLPREIRNLVYTFVVNNGSVVDAHELTPQRLCSENPALFEEWLEAIYDHCTIGITLSQPGDVTNGAQPSNHWGPCSVNKHLIKRLVVNATETRYDETTPEMLERQYATTDVSSREGWKELLRLPRLEVLTINVQKSVSNHFYWRDFGPIIYDLQDKLPKLDITFNISFDNILRQNWGVISWLGANGQWVSHDVTGDPYKPMGFADVSEVIAPPSDEDQIYAQEYFPDAREANSIDCVGGLIEETPSNRRVLARHYIVKEPSLLRVLMAQQFEIYRKVGRLHVDEEKEMS